MSDIIDRIEMATTGHPEVRLIACKLCGVLLWDIDKHYAHAHPESDATDD